MTEYYYITQIGTKQSAFKPRLKRFMTVLVDRITAGDAAWDYLQQYTGIDLKHILWEIAETNKGK